MGNAEAYVPDIPMASTWRLSNTKESQGDNSTAVGQNLFQQTREEQLKPWDVRCLRPALTRLPFTKRRMWMRK